MDGFALKKILSLFLMPFPLGVALILIGLYFLHTRKLKLSKVFFSLSISWLFLFSYPAFVDNFLLHKLESSYPPLLHAPGNVRYIYVLGGGHNSDSRLPITSQLSMPAVVRLNEGIRLYKELGDAKIIVSGYNGNDTISHAKMEEKLATALGIPQRDIIMRTRPRDTEEEAQAAKALIGNTPFILVTSASHMKRAMNFFKAEGLHPIPAPTNHLANTNNIDYTDIFSPTALGKTRLLFHEWIGLAWQWIKGI